MNKHCAFGWYNYKVFNNMSMHGIEYLKKMVKCINYCNIFVCFWHYILPLICKANAQAFPVDHSILRT